MAEDFVRYNVSDRIAEIVLNRPPLNLLTEGFLDAILSAFRRAAVDESVRAVILTTAVNRSFSAGLDLSEVRQGGADHFRVLLGKLYLELFDIQHRLGKPSIAAIKGYARGGGMTLAVSCDCILAGKGATFGYPEIKAGILPGIHFTHLPRIVGRHRAFELLFAGDEFPAARAAEFGLVNRLVEDDRVIDAARELAAAFAAKSPRVMRVGRDAFHRINDLDYRRSIESVVDVMAEQIESTDTQEGLAAFAERREPKW